MTLGEKCAEILVRIRQKRPLVHHITNIVVANDNANTMLALGALPVMAYAREEVEEMVTGAEALVLNLGTPTEDIIKSALLAGKKANALGIPVILDPVGAGATRFRKEAALLLLERVRVTIVRGNAAEACALLGRPSRERGVESKAEAENQALLAREVALKFGVTAAITGAVDYVSDGKRIVAVHNGHPLLTRVTGTGCMATSLCGAFAAVESDALLASLGALGFLGVCAERAIRDSQGPGSFRMRLFDVMYSLSEDDFCQESLF